VPAPEEALSARNITFTGDDGAEINAYQARPAGAGPFPGVLVIHHLPGWDSGTKEITRRFAATGYNALCPNLYARQGLDVDPDDAAAATREAGGIPDDQFVGDADAAVKACPRCPRPTARSASSATARAAGTRS
jgi:carboxymethylenebutenolidase